MEYVWATKPRGYYERQRRDSIEYQEWQQQAQARLDKRAKALEEL